MMVYFMQRWIFGPLIPALMADFHVDRTALGLVGSASMWGYMFTPIVAGLVSDRFGRKYAILTGIFGFSVLTAVCGLLHSTSQLFIGRFLTGMVEAFYFIPLLALVLELFPERPGFFLTFLTSGSSLGWFIGPALAGWLLDLTGSWRMPFLATGVLGLVIGFLLLSFWPEQKRKFQSSTGFDRSILNSSSLVMLLFLSFTAAFEIAAEFGFGMWFPVFLKTELGSTATMAGVIAGLWGAGQCAGRPVLGWASDKLGYRLVGVTGAGILVICLVLVLSLGGPWVKGLLTFTAGFTGAAVMGSLWTFTGLVFPTNRGLALGLITTFAYVTGSFSPLGIGYIGDHHSVSTGLWVIAIPCSFLAGCSFLSTALLKPPKGGHVYSQSEKDAAP